MFNVLTAHYGQLDGLSFLDMFAGTGKVAIHATSLGCTPVTLIDKNNININIINNFNFIKADCYKYDLRDNKYDIIFLDPPYDEHLDKQIILINNLYNNNLNNNGCVILESRKDNELHLKLNNFNNTKIKFYGDTVLTFIFQ